MSAGEFPNLVELRRRGLVFRPGRYRDPEPDRSWVFTTPTRLGVAQHPWVFRWEDDGRPGAPGWAWGPMSPAVVALPWDAFHYSGLELVRVVRTSVGIGPSTLLEPWDPGLEDDRPQREDGLEADAVRGLLEAGAFQDEVEPDRVGAAVAYLRDAARELGHPGVPEGAVQDVRELVLVAQRMLERLHDAPNTADRRGG